MAKPISAAQAAELLARAAHELTLKADELREQEEALRREAARILELAQMRADFRDVSN